MNQATSGKPPILKLVLDRVVRTCQPNQRMEPSVPGQEGTPMPPGTRRTLRATVVLPNRL